MKTIIASTDFTPSSFNACKYAALLAQKLKCKLVLFNVFEGALYHSNVGLYGYSYLPIKNMSSNKIDDFMALLKKQFPKIKIEQFLTNANFKSELELFISKHQVKCAVVGLETKTRIEKFIFGSHTIDIAGKIETPVIIVPQSYKIHKLSKILLAVDNNEKLQQTSLKEFGAFVEQTKTKLNVLHIKTEDEFYNNPVITSLTITGKKYSIEVIKAKDVLIGVKKSISVSHADMITVISKKHSIFYNLFSETTTKKIAFATKIPVMAIHK